MRPDEFEIDVSHVAPLGNDTIPDANQSHFCHSCETPFTGVYCTACGQKNDDYRRSLFSLGKEFFGSITAIESRIWRTWASLLFKPGKVAREYASGRRTHWSSPVRVYVAMSIILFGFLNITQTQLISIDIDVKLNEGVTKPASELTAEDVKLSPSLRFFETKKTIDARNNLRNFDPIAQRLNRNEGLKLNIDLDDVENTVTKPLDQALQNGEIEPEQAAEIQEALDMLKGPADSIKEETDKLSEETAGLNTSSVETPPKENKMTFSGLNGKVYEIDSWSNILFVIVKNPSSINGAFFKYLPRIMFVMMPFTMLIGAMFIRGRGNALLYDHLVHTAYIHAVAFSLLLLGILLSLVFPGSAVSKILFFVLLIYLPLSLKRMFNRGWLKTIWTSYGVGFIYAFNLSLIMFALLVMQVLIKVTEMGTPLPA